MCVRIPDQGNSATAGDGYGTADYITGKHKVQNIEYAWGVLIRRLRPSGAQHLATVGKVPVATQCIEKNNGESMYGTNETAKLEVEVDIGDKVLRVILTYMCTIRRRETSGVRTTEGFITSRTNRTSSCFVLPTRRFNLSVSA